MRIYLIRHADAVDARTDLPDEHRFLSLGGRQSSRAVGRVLRENGVSFDAVLSSPLVRAVQTAEIIADAVGHTSEVEATRALSPGTSPRVAAGLLSSRGEAVAVVGHEPGLSTLGALLVGQPSFPPFQKTQVTLVEQGRPVWWLDPDRLDLKHLAFE